MNCQAYRKEIAEHRREIKRLRGLVQDRLDQIRAAGTQITALREHLFTEHKENAKLRTELRTELQSQARQFVTTMLSDQEMSARVGEDLCWDSLVVEVQLRPAEYRRVIPRQAMINGGPAFMTWVRREIAEEFGKFLCADWTKQTQQDGRHVDNDSGPLADGRCVPRGLLESPSTETPEGQAGECSREGS
jgi:hypothetical protein